MEEDKKACPNCGHENLNSAKFCSKCGYSFNSSTKYSKKAIAEETKKEFNFIMDSATSRINGWAGGKGAVKVNLFKFFGSVFKSHTKEDADDVFEAGTPKTTPSLKELANDDVRPWLFSRILVSTLFLGMLAYQLVGSFPNQGTLYTMAAIVASAIPISSLVLFFEVNVFKNISFYQVIKIALLGGILATISTIKYNKLSTVVGANPAASFSSDQNIWSSFFSSLPTGFIEELAIVLIAARFVKTLKAKSVLNGLLIGASVGAGFSIFENISYVIEANGSAQTTLQFALIRTALSIATYTEWGAIITAALVLVKGSRELNTSDFFDFQFLKFFGVVVAIQIVWNWNILSNVAYVKYAVLSLITWIIVFVLIHAGLQQVNRLKLALKQNKQLTEPNKNEE